MDGGRVDRSAPPASPGGPSARRGRGGTEGEVILDPFPGSEHVDPALVLAGPGYTSMPQGRHPLARLALGCAAVGMVIAPLLVLSLLMGAVALLPAWDREGVGTHHALAAVVISLVGLGAWALLLVQVFAA